MEERREGGREGWKKRGMKRGGGQRDGGGVVE